MRVDKKTVCIIVSLLVLVLMSSLIITAVAAEPYMTIIEVDIGLLFNQGSWVDIVAPVIIPDYTTWNHTDYYDISSVKLYDSDDMGINVDQGDHINLKITLTTKNGYVFDSAVIGKINGVIVEVNNQSVTEIVLEWDFILEDIIQKRPDSPVTPKLLQEPIEVLTVNAIFPLPVKGQRPLTNSEIKELQQENDYYTIDVYEYWIFNEDDSVTVEFRARAKPGSYFSELTMSFINGEKIYYTYLQDSSTIYFDNSYWWLESTDPPDPPDEPDEPDEPVEIDFTEILEAINFWIELFIEFMEEQQLRYEDLLELFIEYMEDQQLRHDDLLQVLDHMTEVLQNLELEINIPGNDDLIELLTDYIELQYEQYEEIKTGLSDQNNTIMIIMLIQVGALIGIAALTLWKPTR